MLMFLGEKTHLICNLVLFYVHSNHLESTFLNVSWDIQGKSYSHTLDWKRPCEFSLVPTRWVEWYGFTWGNHPLPSFHSAKVQVNCSKSSRCSQWLSSLNTTSSNSHMLTSTSSLRWHLTKILVKDHHLLKFNKINKCFNVQT